MMTGRSCLYRYAFWKTIFFVQHNLSQKISHSSHNLRIDNIRGSFNGSDIMREIEGLDNSPQNFEEIYELHCCFTFDDNLERLVETTNSIVGTRKSSNLLKVSISTYSPHLKEQSALSPQSISES